MSVGYAAVAVAPPMSPRAHPMLGITVQTPYIGGTELPREMHHHEY